MWIVLRRARIIGALMCAAVAAAPARAVEEPVVQAAPSYSELVARLRGGQAGVDFGALRRAYADDPAYDPYGAKINTFVHEMHKAYGDHDCTTAMARAERVLELNFVYLDAHFVVGVCHKRAGNEDAARRAILIGRGLLASILKSGDGKTPETAYHVIMVAEEYSVLRSLRVTKEAQALVNADGHSYDRMDGTLGDSGATVTLYFNIDKPLSVLSRQMESKK